MKYHKSISHVFGAIALLNLSYYGFLSLRYGLHYIVFSWSFLLIGIVLLALCLFERKMQRHLLSYLNKPLRILFMLLLLISASIFGVKEALILHAGNTVSPQQGTYAIVLGAQLNGDQISRLLRYRLDAAIAFHQEYPEAVIIVSGGMANSETVTEASAMKAYLVEHGVPAALILEEDQSRNTYENFAFSKKLLKKDTHVSVITNDFHMYRSGYLCEQSGLTCSFYPARSDLDLAPNFYFREFFALMKDQYLTKLY